MQKQEIAKFLGNTCRNWFLNLGCDHKFDKIIVMLRMEKCCVAGHARHGYTAFEDAWS
jgi:hypothetical protein